MAEENKSHAYEAKVGDEGQSVETKDRGLFDLLGKKKEEKPQEEVIATEFEKVKVSEPEHKDEEKKPGLLEKLHRSDSSSCSSSDEEDDEETKKKKKEKKERKGLKEKIQEKIPGQKKHEDTSVPVEKYEDAVHTETEGGHPEDKKGFLEKIKEKLPSHQHKKTEDAHPNPNHPPAAEYSTTSTEAASHEAEAKEKKGFLDKIKEKLPGYHPKTEEEKEKEKEKESAAL